MANAAIVENGIVSSLVVVEVDASGAVVGFDHPGLVLSELAKIGDSYEGGVFTSPPEPIEPPPVQAILSQDLMAQFTADDAGKIQAAIAGNVQFWLLWQALTTQKDPMLVTNARFLAGWSALVQVLGQPRMDAIAVALNVTITP